MKFFIKRAVEVTQAKKPKVVASPNIEPMAQQPARLPSKSMKKPSQQPIQKNAKLEDDFSNLKYIAKHKYFIIRPGRELGVPFFQLLKHDVSKFYPSE
jgi:hypothetical protein